jgi:hypothetical protein
LSDGGIPRHGRKKEQRQFEKDAAGWSVPNCGVHLGTRLAVVVKTFIEVLNFALLILVAPAKQTTDRDLSQDILHSEQSIFAGIL